MKTKEEIRNKLAIELGYSDWQQLIISMVHDNENFEYYEDRATQEYAEQFSSELKDKDNKIVELRKIINDENERRRRNSLDPFQMD